MKIGLIGTFQVGKSTLANCILGDNVASCGIGTPTTHILQSFPDSRGNTIIDTPGLDSAGEDASGDSQLTTDIIPKLDCAILVLPPTMVSEPVREKVLKPLAAADIPVCAVMNCTDHMRPDPNAASNRKTAERIDRDIARCGVKLHGLEPDNATKTLPCNAAWFWIAATSCEKRKFPDGLTGKVYEDRRLDAENHFAAHGEEMPDDEMLRRMSNVPYLLSFLLGCGVATFKPRKDEWDEIGKCPKCKMPYHRGDRFCHSCGKLLGIVPGVDSAELRKTIEKRLARVLELNRTHKVSHEYAWNATVARYADAAGKIRSLLSSGEMACPAHVNDLLVNLDGFLAKSSSPEFQIAMVGTIKAGKSTLLNAMLGGEYASVDYEPETAVLTKFRASETKMNRIEVVYYASAEWKRIWDEVQDKRRKNPEDVRTFLELFEKLGAEGVCDKFLDRGLETFECSDESVLKAKTKDFTSSQSPAHFFVKEVTLRLASLDLPKRVVFVDTPGLDDVLAYRSDITSQYLKRANAVLVCVNPVGGMTGKVLTDVIYRAFDCVHGSHKIFVIGTKKDIISPRGDLSEAWQKIQSTWASLLTGGRGAADVGQGYSSTFKSLEEALSHIIGVSAEYALDLRKFDTSEDAAMDLLFFANRRLGYKADGDADNSRLKDCIREFANIDLLWKRLREDVISRHEALLVEDFAADYRLCAAQVGDFVKDMREICSRRIDTAGQSVDIIQGEIDGLNAKIIEARSRIAEFEARRKEIDNEVAMAVSRLKSGR